MRVTIHTLAIILTAAHIIILILEQEVDQTNLMYMCENIRINSCHVYDQKLVSIEILRWRILSTPSDELMKYM